MALWHTSSMKPAHKVTMDIMAEATKRLKKTKTKTKKQQKMTEQAWARCCKSNVTSTPIDGSGGIRTEKVILCCKRFKYTSALHC